MGAMPHGMAYRSQGVARANVGFPDAPSWQQSIEVIIVASHQVICGAGKYLGVHDVNAVGVQGQGVVRQRPTSAFSTPGRSCILDQQNVGLQQTTS